MDMKIIYAYQAKIHCSCLEQNVIAMDGATISFVLNEEKLESLQICFPNVNVREFEGNFKEKEIGYTKKAFKIATYISNRVFLQSGIDVFQTPVSLFDVSPKYEMETEEEKTLWSTLKKMAVASIYGTFCAVNDIEACKYVEGYQCSLAYSYYADAMRVQNPFLKYRLLFDVLQTYYDAAHGDKFDQLVSDDIQKSSNNYNREFIEKLRKIRNGIEHHNRGDNLNIEN